MLCSPVTDDPALNSAPSASPARHAVASTGRYPAGSAGPASSVVDDDSCDMSETVRPPGIAVSAVGGFVTLVLWFGRFACEVGQRGERVTAVLFERRIADVAGPDHRADRLDPRWRCPARRARLR